MNDKLETKVGETDGYGNITGYTYESVELDNKSYQFNTLRVYTRTGDGAMFYIRDSGCSCPIPFEGVGVPNLNAFVPSEVLAICSNADCLNDAMEFYRGCMKQYEANKC